MILYHGGIGSYKFNRTEPKISVLESYAHTKHPKLKDWMGSYFMDSGAYSVWCSGKTIDLQSFIAFCKEHGKMFTAVAALDVIGSSEGSFENYLRMRDGGLDPIPVFHNGESFSWLEKYLATGATYIGLGGMAKGAPAARMSFIRDVFTRYPDPTKVGFHGFGITAPNLLGMFPWRSCDSTAAAMTAMNGNIISPFGNPTIGSGLDAGRSAKQTTAVMDELRVWVESIGGDWERAVRKDAGGAYERAWISVHELNRIANTAPTTYNPRVKGFQL